MVTLYKKSQIMQATNVIFLRKVKMELIAVSIYFLFWLFGFLFLYRIPSCNGELGARGGYPPISVIIPARNEERSLPSLLSSLHNQTLKPDEIIVVDDNSEDATAEVADKGGAKVIHAKALPEGWHGKAWACWTGAKEAQGEILVFLDADTSVQPDGLLRSGVHTWRKKASFLFSLITK